MRTSRLQPLTLSDAAAPPAFSNPSVLVQNSETKSKEFSGNELPRAGIEVPKTDIPTPPTPWWANLKTRFQGR